MPRPEFAREARLLSRFASTGVANTLVGAGVILALDRGLGVPPAVANLCGYVVGFFVAWRLHRGFVFRDGARDRQTAVKYAVAIVCAFAANQAVLHLVLGLPVDAAVRPVAAQLTAIVSYSALQFLLMRFWVFRQRQGD